MRAVNLVPAESRTGRVNGGRSGGAVYGALGVLLLVLLAASSLAVIKRDKTRSEQELAGVTQSTQAYQQLASQYASFGSAASEVSKRIEVVRSISDARFDWAGSLRELSRVVPASTQILNLNASVKDGIGAGGGGSAIRSAIPTPAISLDGCSRTQDTVASLVTRLQAMRRVTNVTLESSETDTDLTSLDKSMESADGSSAAAAEPADTSGTCSLPKPFYTFAITVFFAPGTSQSSDSISATGTTAVSATSPSGTTPATTPASN